MAVPKRKTSRSRRDKRRAQHGISVPRRPGLPELQAAEATRTASAPTARRTTAGTSSRFASTRRRYFLAVIRVAVDALGGDRAPDEIVAGAAAAASPDIAPILFGPPGIETHGLRSSRRPSAISMDDHPVDAVRAKTDSSLVRAVRAVADGDADVVVSAGNTGAMLAASLLHIRQTSRSPPARNRCRHPDEARPERPRSMPGRTRTRARSTSSQFAHMGSVFAEEILGIERPEVRLMSIGEEDEKGNQLTIDAHELLRPPTFGSRGTRRAGSCSKAARTSSWSTGSPETSP